MELKEMPCNDRAKQKQLITSPSSFLPTRYNINADTGQDIMGEQPKSKK